MSLQAHDLLETAKPYQRLLNMLARRARSRGSRDPEAAAQEAVKRSLQNPQSRPAIEYYFAGELSRGATPPEWSLDQVFAWLHAVLHYVVREECTRVGFHREVPMAPDSPGGGSFDPADPAPDPLEGLIQSELRDIVTNCLPRLEREYREVIRMRMEGLTYSEIAARLRVNENTVATWIARGTRWLAQCIRHSTARKRKGMPHA